MLKNRLSLTSLGPFLSLLSLLSPVSLASLAAVHTAAAHPGVVQHAPSPLQPDARLNDAWTAKAAQALMARTDANSLAAAAALRGTDPELAARASELAPQSPAIGWLRLQLCARSAGCDMRDTATVMRWVDPDNAAAWLPTLAAARRDGDSTEVDRVLADMARAARFDLYWNRIVVLLSDALDTVRRELPGSYAASDSARYAKATGLAAGEIIPPFAPLADACRESISFPQRRALCLELSKTMQRSDTIAVQFAGFSIERRLLAPDGKEARGIAERKRALEWRAAGAAKLDAPLLPWTKNARARERLAAMRTTAREEDVCKVMLRAHKMPLDPPEVHP